MHVFNFLGNMFLPIGSKLIKGRLFPVYASNLRQLSNHLMINSSKSQQLLNAKHVLNKQPKRSFKPGEIPEYKNEPRSMKSREQVLYVVVLFSVVLVPDWDT